MQQGLTEVCERRLEGASGPRVDLVLPLRAVSHLLCVAYRALSDLGKAAQSGGDSGSRKFLCLQVAIKFWQKSREDDEKC